MKPARQSSKQAIRAGVQAEPGGGSRADAGAGFGADAGGGFGEPRPWVAPPPRAALLTHVTKLGIWVMLACGPVALLVAGAAGGQAAPPAKTQTQTQRGPAGPAGFAELYVAAYLRAGTDTPTTTTGGGAGGGGVSPLSSFFPGAGPVSGNADRFQASRTATVGASEVSPGYWSITVAADVLSNDDNGKTRPLGVRYFRVPVLAFGGPETGGGGRTGDPPSYSATALPAEVSPPALGPTARLAYGEATSASGPLADTIDRFLGAYLAGAGEIDRYLTPGTIVNAVTPAPYKQAHATTIRTREKTEGNTVPNDGTRLHVLIDVEATDPTGQKRSLTYALALTARAGRWEINALEPAPAVEATEEPDPQQPPDPTENPTTDPTTDPTENPGPTQPG